MKGLDEIIDAIQWHEGMLLTPQHFQQQSLRQEQLLHHAIQSVAPFFWGILELEIDSGRLADGQFCVLKLEAIMPDGLMVAHRAEQADLSLDLKIYTEDFEQVQENGLLVYLSVRRHSSEFLKDEQRYHSVTGKLVKDANTGEGEISIPRLKPQLKLSLSEKPPSVDRYASIPLARVAYKDGVFVPQTQLLLTQPIEFIPPKLSVSLTSTLGRIINRIIRRARERAEALRERIMHLPTMDKLTLSETKMLQALTAVLPPIEVMLRTGQIHPYTLYTNLCAWAGSMSILTREFVPPEFVPYNHDDLRTTFHQVCTFIYQILDDVHEYYTVEPFDYEEQGRQQCFILKAGLKQEWLLQDRELENYFVLCVTKKPDSTSDDDLETWVESCSIGSSTKIQSMLNNRILGAKRSRINEKEEGLHSPPGVLLFRVKVDEYIEPNKILHIVSEQQTHCPTRIDLYVKNEI